MKVVEQKLILTEEEKNILDQAESILHQIVEIIDEGDPIEWSDFCSDEIYGACEIINSFIIDKE